MLEMLNKIYLDAIINFSLKGVFLFLGKGGRFLKKY